MKTSLVGRRFPGRLVPAAGWGATAALLIGGLGLGCNASVGTMGTDPGTGGATGPGPGTGGAPTSSGGGTGGAATPGAGGSTRAGASGSTGAGDAGTGSGMGGAAGTGGVPAPTGAGGNSGPPGACVESSCGSHKWPCWKMPNPVASGAAVPNHQSYADLGNGAVRDNVTCLVWEKANPATQGTWQQSADRCAALATSSYAGFNDWRMPTRVEMASITDVNNGARGFASIFTVTAGYYGTSSWWYETITGQNTSGFQFGYGTNGFTSNAVAMGGTNNVARCVRGNGAGEAANAFAKEPANHYTVAAGEVTDSYTGLIWQQTYSAARMAWADGPAYCAGLALNGHSGWRMPTLNELASTVNEALVGPAINRTVFPMTAFCGSTTWFWALEASKVGGVAWGINYCDGFTGWNAASATWNTFPDAYVRCVR
jgi:Protein of unknown function (DUF1566)